MTHPPKQDESQNQTSRNPLQFNRRRQRFKSTVVRFDLPSEFSSAPLSEVIQAGAKELPRIAIQAEVSAFIASHAHLLDEDGRQRLVCHGFLPEREMMTGIGTVPVQVPRVRDRGSNEDGSKITFRSAPVLPYLRKAKSVG